MRFDIDFDNTWKNKDYVNFISFDICYWKEHKYINRSLYINIFLLGFGFEINIEKG